MNDVGNSLHISNDGGIIVCGSVESDDGDVIGNNGLGDGWIAKLNNVGSLEWQKCFGGTNYDAFYCLDVNSNGEMILGGGLSSLGTNYSCSPFGDGDFWIVKLDSVGNILWDKCYGGSSRDDIHEIMFTTDGGILAFGYTESIDGDVIGNHALCNGCSSDFWLLKLDGLGNITWSRCFGSPMFEFAYSAIEVAPGYFAACGASSTNGGDVSQSYGLFDYWIILVDSLGTLIWEKSLGGSGNDGAYSLAVASDGNILVVGEASSNDGHITNPFGGPDVWLAKLSVTGSLLWEKSFGGPSFDAGFSLATQGSDQIAILAKSTSNSGQVNNNHGFEDFWFIICDSSGNLLEANCFGGSASDIPSKLIAYQNGYAAVGYTDSFDGDINGNHGPINCGFLECLDLWLINMMPISSSIQEFSYTGTLYCTYIPESNLLKAKWRSFDGGLAYVVVSDYLGKVIKEFSHIVIKGDNNIQIELPEIKSNVLYISILNSSSRFAQKIFIY